MSRKSLRQQKKDSLRATINPNEASKHLHLVKGQYDHKHTHSVTPISADDVERLHNIDPTLVPRLFGIIESGLQAEKEETKKFYEAVEREQENDKLAITSKADNDKKAMNYAFFTIFFLVFVGALFIYFNHEYIGGAVITTVLLGVVKAMLGKKDKSEKENE
ncbi:hypothetical protein RJ999_08090 [Aliarcobacter butzleri]|uniref:hypothetical protein n=1 Tax=Aliarcobacter butzleri TaxID=28197 RepID=UPI0028769DBC|nr:hypothetical protein [Aliarcobacter butzleri]MDS1371052.1 hypothetical protein [Aliarcobacter butzleri]